MSKTPSPEVGRPEEPGLGYEQARDELVAVVQKLEAGGAGLEESLALWERGEELAAICQRWLDGARERLSAASGQDVKESGDSDAM
jgi:exodeoxyribonuclease VII small subunit